MMLIDYMTMKNGDYHEKQIAYNMTAMLAEIKREYPDDLNPDLSDPKFAHITKESHYSPAIMGGLAKDLGIENQVLTLDLWRDLSNGYCPARYLPKDSPLSNQVKDTPRGPMVVLNSNATPMDAAGTYRPEEAGKKRAIGTEFVFGMAGNFSKVMARMMTEDETVLKQFNNIANEVFSTKILPAMLEDAMVRTGKDGVNLNYAQSIMATNFMHIENRGADTVIDGQKIHVIEPYLHFHFDVLNVARGFDDKLTALYSGEIAKNKDAFNALFQAEMKERLENEMGFVFKEVILDEEIKDDFLKDHEKNICSYDIPDSWVPKQVQEFYSGRANEMKAAQKGKQGFIAEEIARVTSREEKSELSPSEMKTMWKEQMDGMGWTTQSIREQLNFKQVRAGFTDKTDEQLAHNFVRKLQKTGMDKNGAVEYGKPNPDQHLTDPDREKILVDGFLRKHKEVCFTASQFQAHMVKQLIKDFDKESAIREAARIFESQCVHMVAKDKIDYYKDFLADRITDPHEYKQKQIRFNREMMFTTKEVLAQERYMFDTAKEREFETQFTIPEQKAAKRLLAFEEQMSKEIGKPVTCTKGQRDTFMAAMTKPGANMFVIGDAGTGKSFVARGIKEAYEDEGKEVWAVAPTNKAVVGLASDAKFKEGRYGSLAKILHDLEEGKIKWNTDTVIIGDEMGMACQDEYYRLMKFANDAKAKIISIGDAKQVQSVSHGSNFRIMSEHFVSEKLTEISRQHSLVHREMVQDFAYGRAHKGVRTLYDENRVVITNTDEEKQTQLVADYLADPADYKKKAIVTGTNMESEVINNQIREQLKAQGKLSADPKQEARIMGKDGIERGFCVGDRMMFFKGQKSDDVQSEKMMNSELGTVKALRETYNKLTKKTSITAVQVSMDNGKTIWISTQKEQSVKHGYSSTVHKSQGSTYDSAYYMPGANLDSLHIAYVACSRHRKDLKMYLSDEMADKMAEQMEDKEPTAKMLNWAQNIAAQKGLELSDDAKSSFIDIRKFLNEHAHVINGRETEPVHRMDDFASIIERWSTTMFKKSTYDFEILDGKAVDAYHQAKAMQKEMHVNPDQHKIIVPDSKGNEPDEAYKDMMTNLKKQAISKVKTEKQKDDALVK